MFMFEIIVISLGYFGLLGLMVYKGADFGSILSAAVLFVSSYFGLSKLSKSVGAGSRSSKLHLNKDKEVKDSGK